jgi:hypothetical protein
LQTATAGIVAYGPAPPARHECRVTDGSSGRTIGQQQGTAP